MNVKKYLKIVLLSFLVCLSVFLGVAAARFVSSPFMHGEHGNAIVKTPRGGRANILVVGMDEVGYNTDTILIFSIDTKDDSLSILSIPRDTRIKIGNSFYKINAAYAYAMNTGKKKEEFLIERINELTSLPIHYYAIVNLSAFRDIVDALDGVEFDVKRNYYYSDPVQNLYINIKKGYQVLDGKNAEGLVRYRHDYAMGDLERIQVQQEFLQALISQKLKPSYLSRVPDIYNKLSQKVISNLTLSDIMKFGKAAVKFDRESINTIMLPGESRTISGASYFIKDDAKMEELINTEFN